MCHLFVSSCFVLDMFFRSTFNSSLLFFTTSNLLLKSIRWLFFSLYPVPSCKSDHLSCCSLLRGIGSFIFSIPSHTQPVLACRIPSCSWGLPYVSHFEWNLIFFLSPTYKRPLQSKLIFIEISANVLRMKASLSNLFTSLDSFPPNSSLMHFRI